MHFGRKQDRYSSRSSQARDATGADKYDGELPLEATQCLDFRKEFVFKVVTIDDRTIRPPLREKQANGHLRGVQSVDILATLEQSRRALGERSRADEENASLPVHSVNQLSCARREMARRVLPVSASPADSRSKK